MNSSDLQNKTRPFTISLPARIDESSKALAAKLRVSRSQLIAALLDIADGKEPQTPEAKVVTELVFSRRQLPDEMVEKIITEVTDRVKSKMDIDLSSATKRLGELRTGSGKSKKEAAS